MGPCGLWPALVAPPAELGPSLEGFALQVPPPSVAAWLQVHLFDIDIPGKITFKESLTLTGGEGLTVVDTEVRAACTLRHA